MLSGIALDLYSDEDELEFNEIPKLLPRSHPALKYRGNSVARTKLWLQTDFDHGMKRYGYRLAMESLSSTTTYRHLSMS